MVAQSPLSLSLSLSLSLTHGLANCQPRPKTKAKTLSPKDLQQMVLATSGPKFRPLEDQMNPKMPQSLWVRACSTMTPIKLYGPLPS